MLGSRDGLLGFEVTLTIAGALFSLFCGFWRVAVCLTVFVLLLHLWSVCVLFCMLSLPFDTMIRDVSSMN